MYNLKITTLKGRQDVDVAMLHAVMQLLVNYVETENPEQTDWNTDAGHREAWATIQEVYNWWKQRPHRVEIELDVPDDFMIIGEPDEHGNSLVTFKDYPEIHAGLREIANQDMLWYQEDTEMIKKIVDVRGYLWT